MESDADEGEDKIAKKARIEQLEPMEIVQHYTFRYHDAMRMLNVLPPSIEPRASGHIIEQIELVKRIIDNGFAYEKNGSVYFDVEKYHAKHNYGKLSGRVLEDMISGYRELEGQDEKRNSVDFALWKKATPEHIMRWPSPWSVGFPGWHLECSAMSTKYLGEPFDIHGGGMDLLFPHHECEIAQSVAASGKEAVRYWMHNNMITINGQKMGKSLGNFITLEELFTGTHKMLEQAYSPMTIRFFMLQAHYRSTLDFSNEALQAAEKGLNRLMAAVKSLEKVKASEKSTVDVSDLSNRANAALCDDLNSPIAIAALFDWVRIINTIVEGNETITQSDLESLKSTFKTLTFDILGLLDEQNEGSKYAQLTGNLIEMLLAMRQQAKANKDFTTSDRIRDELNKLGVAVKDRKDGFDWEIL
jgi:cysteinyl-tRNA synthetase